MLALVSSVLAQVPPPIVNGELAEGMDEVVLIYSWDSGSGYGAMCSGSLIAEEWVLTAAHCVTNSGGFRITDMVVYVGDTVNTLEQEAEADDWFGHDDYDGSGFYDIGLVHLRRTFNDVPLMAVNKDSIRDTMVGDDYRAVGYGATSDNDSNSNSKRRYADLPLYDYDGLMLYTYDTQDDQNVCHGDSGGPLLELLPDGAYEVAGVNDFVFGNNPDCEGNAAGEARVDKFISWIEESTPVFSWDELYGDADTDADADADSDADSDTDTDTDSDSDGDIEATPADIDDPIRPLNVGENYDTACATAPAAAPWAGLLGALALLRRRR